MEDLKEENLSDENFQNFQNLSEENFQNNPWTVTNLEEFLYYCCPECDISRETIYQSRELFLKHAFDTHPLSKACLENVIVKKEIVEEKNSSENFEEYAAGESMIENQNYYDISENYYDNSMVKCELNEDIEDKTILQDDEYRDREPEYLPYRCTVCGKGCKGKTHLKDHMLGMISHKKSLI